MNRNLLFPIAAQPSGIARYRLSYSANSLVSGPILNRNRPHRIDRSLAAQYARDIRGTFGLQLFERLDRIEGGVRRENHVVAADKRRIAPERFGRDHVERGAAKLTAVERRDERSLIDERS